MKHFLALLLLAPVLPLTAQQTGIDQASELLVVPAGDKFLHWYGHADRSYFLQVSDANNPLAKWFWAPVIEGGNNEEISYEVDGTASKGFFRLLHTTLPQPPGVTLEEWDADDDRLHNWEEITTHGSNPLKSDTDDDGLPDDWEIAHGLNALDDGAEDPDRGPDAPFGSPPSGSQSASAFAAPEPPLTNAQAFAAGVRAVPGATLADKDGDLIPDAEDADPLSLAVNWRKSPKPVYVAVPVPSWSSATHSFPVALNNRNDVLTRRAVYKNGQWISLNGNFSSSSGGAAMSYKFLIAGRLHTSRLGFCVVNSISDQGDIMGSGQIAIDPVTETDPVTGQVTIHGAGLLTDFAMIWRNPQALPEIFGVAPGATLQGEKHLQSGTLHRDGTVIVSNRRPEDIQVNSNTTLLRYPSPANGGGIQTSPVFIGPSNTYPALNGTFAFGSFLSNSPISPILSWVWPTSSGPQSLYSVTRSAPGAPGLNFQSFPTMIGSAPGGEACVNLSGHVLVGHSGRYYQVPALQGATKISPHGAALLPGTFGNPAIWYGGSTYSLSSCVVNPQALGTSLTVTDVNENGSILAIVNVGTGSQKLVILVPIDIEEVISDQIAGNEANKLPTAHFGGQPNNPMVMASRTGMDTRLMIKMNVPSTYASTIRVGVRAKDSTAILDSAPCVAAPAKTPLAFTALRGSQIYEIVAGYDADSDDILDPTEVTTVFQKTPKTNTPASGGGSYTGPNWNLVDKFIVVTQTDFANARTATEGYSGLPYSLALPNSSKLIGAFATGAKTISGTNPTTFGNYITANGIGTPTSRGLSLPLGAKWDSANEASTHLFDFPDGSDLSELIKRSNTMQLLISRLIASHKSEILGFAQTGSWITHTLVGVEDENVDFSADPLTDMFYSLKKCKFEGNLEVEMTAVPGGFNVRYVRLSGVFIDLYDFAWPGGLANVLGLTIDIGNATKSQAGHATLTAASHPDAGRVFYTRVATFNVGKDFFASF